MTLTPPLLAISIRTEIDTTSWSYGKSLFETLIKYEPRLTPQEIGADPRVESFVTVESAKARWGERRVVGGDTVVVSTLNWTRNSELRGFGFANFAGVASNGKTYGGGVVLGSEFSRSVDWQGMFRTLVCEFGASAGLLHVVAGPEITAGPYDPPTASSFCKPLVRQDLDQFPNLSWATWFGSRFADEADFSKIAQDGYLVEPMLGGFLVRITPSITDVLDDFPTFSRRRSMLKTYFRPELFKIKHEPGESEEIGGLK
jgi:hypothetical protein